MKSNKAKVRTLKPEPDHAPAAVAPVQTSAPAGEVRGLFASPVALSSFLDQLPLGVMVLDLEGRTLLVNRSFEVLSGFSREEAYGVPCRHILRSNLCLRQCPFAEAEKSGGPAAAEGDLISRDRRLVLIRLTTTLLQDAAGNPVGFLETVEDISHLKKTSQDLRQAFGFGQMLGRSPKMQELFRILPIIAQTDSSVLITGETGTGKDLAAEAIHEASARSRGPFIKINCGALPETLLESELFGHQKGAFTGAVSDKPGRLRLAHGGSLFLTEIGDLPHSLQAKLLTFLDDKIVHPLGSTRGFQADVRVIAATHRHLESMVRKGDFREDLLFRLNVVRVHLPPLRERNGDIGLLLDHFLKQFNARFDKKIKGFSKEVRRLLDGYSYPGNVREIRNIVEYSANMCSLEEIRQEHLPAYLFEKPEPVPEETKKLPPRMALWETGPDSELNWSSIEKNLIVEALVQAKGKRSRAAGILGWGRSTLWRKMKQHGLEQ